tara:strand:+ start:115 stop:591 length:477 start_codon:yes stop_codon:yes gene_type:complete
LKKIQKLNKSSVKLFLELIHFEGNHFLHFKKNGWSDQQVRQQFKKEINFSIGVFKDNLLIAFILGDLIYVEKNTEYEILIIYVKNNYRKQGLATKLLNYLEKQKKVLKLKKIYLEVAKINKKAIFFYEKNNYKLINIRAKYYSIDNKKIDAFCYSKIL